MVHLYRHPVSVAASLTTHGVYSRDDWSRVMSITPEATGDGRAAYPASRWAALSEFEKCLFWWTEINRHALNLKRSFPETAWCSVSYAELLLDKNPHSIGRLLEFLRLPARESFIQGFGEVVDAHEKKTTAAIDDSVLDRYPDALAIMRELGFERDADGLRSYIDRRYRTTSLANWLARKAKRLGRNTSGRGKQDKRYTH